MPICDDNDSKALLLQFSDDACHFRTKLELSETCIIIIGQKLELRSTYSMLSFSQSVVCKIRLGIYLHSAALQNANFGKGNLRLGALLELSHLQFGAE